MLRLDSYASILDFFSDFFPFTETYDFPIHVILNQESISYHYFHFPFLCEIFVFLFYVYIFYRCFRFLFKVFFK